MKLFQVDYIDDCDEGTFLTVGNSKEEVEERVARELSQELSCYMGSWVYEIDEVDGYKVTIEKL